MEWRVTVVVWVVATVTVVVVGVSRGSRSTTGRTAGYGTAHRERLREGYGMTVRTAGRRYDGTPGGTGYEDSSRGRDESELSASSRESRGKNGWSTGDGSFGEFLWTTDETDGRWDPAGVG